MGEKKIDSKNEQTAEETTNQGTQEGTQAELESKKLRRYLTPNELREKVVDWSNSTLKRRIQNEGFPAIKDGNSILIPEKEMKLWFKKRGI